MVYMTQRAKVGGGEGVPVLTHLHSIIELYLALRDPCCESNATSSKFAMPKINLRNNEFVEQNLTR
jgi:hypothetical protein